MMAGKASKKFDLGELGKALAGPVSESDTMQEIRLNDIWANKRNIYPEPDAAAFCARAREQELLLVPGDDFGCPGYVRIAYCVAPETIEGALPRFRALAESYGNGEKQV